MNRFFGQRRDSVRPARMKSARPGVEGLEDRLLLFATNGGEWTYPVRVTYSFMPDGTSIGGTPSNLFSTMNAFMSTATWQYDLARAAAIWEGAAGVNLVQVSDDGTAAGSGSYQQGAPNIGDIRIGAMPEPGGQLAMAFLPPPLNGGSAAGDIVFNSNVNWSAANGYDLISVALHELGHALGMGHSTTSTAVMYGTYTGINQTLSTDDVSGIDSIYGVRTSSGNGKMATAVPIALNSAYQATVTGVDAANAIEQDWYSVVVPQGTSGTLTVTMQSANLSSLAPRLTLYNSSGRGLAQALSTAYGATVSVTLNGVSAGQTYYIRANATSSGPGSAGAYGLTVNAGTGTMPAIAPPNTTVLIQPNQGGGTSDLSADPFQTGRQPLPRHVHGVTIGELNGGMGDAFVSRVRKLRHGRTHH